METISVIAHVGLPIPGKLFRIITTTAFIGQVLNMYIDFEKSMKQDCHLFLAMTVLYLDSDSFYFTTA